MHKIGANGKVALDPFREGPERAERGKCAEMAPWIWETVVDGEDFRVAGLTEPGVMTCAIEKVFFGRNEPTPQHLHRGFEAALAAARPDTARPDTARPDMEAQ